MTNKKGSKKLTIFLSEEEIDILKQDAKLRRVSLHEYIIDILAYQYRDYEYLDDCNFAKTIRYDKSIERNKKLILFLNEDEIDLIDKLYCIDFNVTELLLDYLYENKGFIKWNIEYCKENNIYSYEDDITNCAF